MFDHVSIGVADIARSKKFYDAAPEAAGLQPAELAGETSLGYGDKKRRSRCGSAPPRSPLSPTPTRACISASSR